MTPFFHNIAVTGTLMLGSTIYGHFLQESIPGVHSPVSLESKSDLGLYFYRQERTRERVVEFYSRIAGSREIAELVLESASKENIALPLAFGLAWAESAFNPKAVNMNRYSIDRGLYQLNSRSFPALSEKDFFDPAKNVSIGLAYLKECIEAGGNDVAGLAMYNAGRTRVTTSGTPKVTLDYIAKILDFSSSLHSGFMADMNLTHQVVIDPENSDRITICYLPGHTARYP